MAGKLDCGSLIGWISWWVCDYLYLWNLCCQMAAVTLCGSNISLGLGAKGHALKSARGYLGRGVVDRTITIVSGPRFLPLTSLVNIRFLCIDMKITAMLSYSIAGIIELGRFQIDSSHRLPKPHHCEKVEQNTYSSGLYLNRLLPISANQSPSQAAGLMTSIHLLSYRDVRMPQGSQQRSSDPKFP